MTKHISTVVPDVYAVLENGVDLPENQEEAEQVSNFILQFASNMGAIVTRRLVEEEEPRVGMRLSSLGQCIKKQWYQQHDNSDPEKLTGPTLLKFMFGDLIEELLLLLVRLSGHEVRGEQDEIRVGGVLGHRDAVIDGYTVDVKSASKYSFEKFKDGSIKNNDSFGYMEQLAAYMQGADDVEQDAAFNLVMGKELGNLTLFKLPVEDMIDAAARVREVSGALLDDTTPPPRPHEAHPDGKSGNMKLPGTCSYCPFKFKCWSDSNNGAGLRTFIYSAGPRYLTAVEREPNVQENL